jgi:hypothetical protein
MKIFGKSLSDYIRFERRFLILVLVVGLARLALSLLGVPNSTVKFLSLTVLYLLGMLYYSSTSRRAATASSGESWPVATRPGCRWDLPDVISANLSPDAWSPTPASHRVHLPVSSPMSSAFPHKGRGQLPASPANTIFPRSVFPGCRHSFMFRPPSLLISQIVPTAARFSRRAAETSRHRVLRCLRTRRIG